MQGVQSTTRPAEVTKLAAPTGEGDVGVHQKIFRRKYKDLIEPKEWDKITRAKRQRARVTRALKGE